MSPLRASADREKQLIYELLALRFEAARTVPGSEVDLWRLQECVRNRSSVRVVRRLATWWAEGRRLSEAMGSLRRTFSPWEVHMAAAGDAIGRPDVALRALAELLQRRRRLRHARLSLAIYPVVMIVSGFLISVVLLVKVYPTLATFWERSDFPRPWLFSLLMLVVRGFTLGSTLAVAIGASIWFTLYASKDLPGWKIVRGLFLLTRSQLIEARMLTCRMVAASLDAGGTALDGLRAASECQPNAWLGWTLRRAVRRVDEGEDLEARGSRSVLSRALVRLLRSPSAPDRLRERWEAEARRLEERLRYRDRCGTMRLEILTILLLGVVMGFLVLAFYQGIFSITVPGIGLNA